MNRREFIYHAAVTSAAAGMAGGLPLSVLGSGGTRTDLPRSLVNVMLHGGADFRYMLMPAPSHPGGAYVEAIWSARRSLYGADYGSYAEMFDHEYLLASDPFTGLEFGIHERCGWLHGEFAAGRVAIVANAYCSRNRRHDQSILNADAGEPDLAQLNFDRDGWGGRLVEAIGGTANVVELGQSVSVFGKGSTPGARLERVVHAQDTRNMELAGVDGEISPGSRRNVLARALHAWYKARGPEVALEHGPEWPFHTFFQHHASLQEFGLAVRQRMEQCGPLPAQLQELALNREEFAQQCKNLYDACQMPDVLGSRVLSMNYGGWDTHDNEAVEMGGNLEDLFGASGGLAVTVPLIGSLPYLEQPAHEQLLFYFASDFGRQLRSNGAAGTDHGRGTYALLMGYAVRGGIYGELFPEREINPDGGGRVPMDTPGADIEGLTSTEHILAGACGWVSPGASKTVFPGAASAGIEKPGLLDSLVSG